MLERDMGSARGCGGGGCGCGGGACSFVSDAMGARLTRASLTSSLIDGLLAYGCAGGWTAPRLID